MLLELFYTVGKESITGANLQVMIQRLGKVDEVLQRTPFEAHYKVSLYTDSQVTINLLHYVQVLILH